MTTTTIIGDVIKKVSGPVNKPPPGVPPQANPGGGKPGGGGGIGASAFETAIGTESPLVWYTFRDNNFKQRIRDRAGSRHLAKQIAEATRSAVPTRSTHPGGALFNGVTAANWATQGQFYKGPTGVLNGASAYTMLVSVRFLSRKAFNQTIFGLGTEGTTVNGSNYILNLFDASAVGLFTAVRHRTGGGNDNLAPLITERTEDGVNRLFTVRSTGSSSQILKISKPGAKYVTEDTASQAALAAVNRALLLNAQDDTVQDSPKFVIDQIALWDGDIGAAAESNLHDLWTAELGGYYPSRMDFDGSTGYYNGTFTSSGNKVTVTATFKLAAKTSVQTICFARGDSAIQRIFLMLRASNDATVERRNKLLVLGNNDAGANILNIVTSNSYADNAQHTVFVEWDADAGTARMVVDGASDINTGATAHAVGTATLDAGASEFVVGGSDPAAPVNLADGEIGFVGYADVAGLDPDDFMSGNLPAAIDEVNWTEWGARPLFWSHTGQMDNNKGSAGDMTLNGSVVMTEGGSP